MWFIIEKRILPSEREVREGVEESRYVNALMNSRIAELLDLDILKGFNG